MEKEINYFKRAIELTHRYQNHGKNSHQTFHRCCLYRHLLYLIGEKKFNFMFVYHGVMDDFEKFQKIFRQTDVSGNAHIDMIMWNFIMISGLPQRIHFAIQNRNFDGTPQDPDFQDFDEFWEE